MFIVDSHCHLDALDYDNLHKNIADVVEKAYEREVKHLLAIGVTLSRFEKTYEQLKEFDNISLACGVHPLDFEEEPYDSERLLRLAQDKKVIAIGEIGLDYYYSAENKAAQQAIFADQIHIANQLNKPVIIHTRSAGDDTISLLRENQAENCGGVIHCFTETLDFAKKALDLGFYISCSGIITFKNAEAIREAIRYVPLDRLLVETDSPYLAPVPYRGKENQPAYTREVCEYVAALKGLAVEEFAQITTQNFERLFKINVQ
ncbi:YchF/TatD family DNA exonuclease [Rodentibacter trehalosifermentans]|uniref:Metal-dependent hydrolase n=1 Tax=Rodentibacter trehalosifermentans TaxID=1908263 RepID=A0A1V3J0K5_9PAST|nr:YchF/TatD family DNA exonuclease [Rodentibacter trehalosifermentans]OOF46325.1 metal-dependent hydrolase [Rodentibacter trehalosifermentans]OOF48460.1 metal-dependent hydrolase [Rodentibacter trehalosifermentans]OOF53252.1 metal-dependent hydrolase [Rodentibacter trehalosifermentans]